MVIRRFEETLRLYFFNKQNTQHLTKILKELKQTMNTEPYTTAHKKVDTTKLLPSQKSCFLYADEISCRSVGTYRLKQS